MKIQALKINQGTKFGTLKKPMFSLFDVIIFWFNGKINHKIFRARLLVSNIWYNRLPRIISPHFCAKKEIIAPGYYSRKYGNSWKRKRTLLLVLFLTLWVKRYETGIHSVDYINLVPRGLSYPPYGARGRVGENPGNEVGITSGDLTSGD